MTKDDDFKLLKGFALGLMDEQMDGQTDICNSRVTFATENHCQAKSRNLLEAFISMSPPPSLKSEKGNSH